MIFLNYQHEVPRCQTVFTEADYKFLRAAELFACQAHRGQTRKYTGEPYIRHPRAVFDILLWTTTDPEILAAGLLHDVVEDTSFEIEDIEHEFSPRVAQMVWDLTDRSIYEGEGLNRAARKKLDREHIKGGLPESKTIKLADLLDNTRTIVLHDPEFAKVYMHEKVCLLSEALFDGHKGLYILACQVVARYYKENGQS
jgi:(p)ppGpp synthase/HD superfamily hydrolase